MLVVVQAVFEAVTELDETVPELLVLVPVLLSVPLFVTVVVCTTPTAALVATPFGTTPGTTTFKHHP